MVDYTKDQARAWAKAHWKGAIAVTMPSYTPDFSKVNENAIRHDILKLKELGFAGTLLVTELNVTPEENARITAVAREVAGADFHLFFHAAFNTLEENIHALKLAEKEGVDSVLVSYPTAFWPTSHQEVYDYTKALTDSTKLSAMLFALPAWGFERIDPAGMPVSFVRHVLDTIPNIVAVKSEQGYPTIGGIMEMYHHFRDEVIISCPIESETIPLMSVLDFQFSGTSNTNWMSDYFPRAFALAQSGEWEEAMQLWWQVSPARAANVAILTGSSTGTTVINRTGWKYQEWLAGFNGGALRAPAPRIPDRLMKQARAALVASGLPVTDLPDSEFVKGRTKA
ncbi:dihydrodipicolinate synthase family protein [Pseudoclavibacter chungangensis]|uniref:Dihydrodipicolinate synthase family protein n=1 Tax=Pseudoclavibacter chungangensis TaxID=587635 RepID=A0A7J5BPP2_9MICO|nr:dihydrodipicolinate synthase family protein [Pseudoclavibacter chungangensis]KAB1652839.1 dihydrodipicolinate synthase family protein [Pseudoclavibacter chungangensis]NYJ67166.1 4-hydroxy-tetrahydrodipicolinate synthase [Pseudoclavibacter chungangensis]